MAEKPRRQVAYARSTWRKAEEFARGLKELGEKMPPSMIRHYYLTGRKSRDYEEALYQEIDDLFSLRESGIRGEMKYAEAQAERNGIEIPGDVLAGKSLQIDFPQLEEKAPSLGVYRLFIPFTEEEFRKNG